jgi:hypothetical protein
MSDSGETVTRREFRRDFFAPDFLFRVLCC